MNRINALKSTSCIMVPIKLFLITNNGCHILKKIFSFELPTVFFLPEMIPKSIFSLIKFKLCKYYLKCNEAKLHQRQGK